MVSANKGCSYRHFTWCNSSNYTYVLLTSFFTDFIKCLAQRWRKGSKMNEDSLLPFTISQDLRKYPSKDSLNIAQTVALISAMLPSHITRRGKILEEPCLLCACQTPCKKWAMQWISCPHVIMLATASGAFLSKGCGTYFFLSKGCRT